MTHPHPHLTDPQLSDVSSFCLPLQGDLVYVNYGRTEDFFQLEREMGINVTEKIVIVRYGKIFRGNKVRKLLYHNSSCSLNIRM